MGKTFRRDKPFRPKAHGRVYNKDVQQPWKKQKRRDDKPQIVSDDIPNEP